MIMNGSLCSSVSVSLLHPCSLALIYYPETNSGWYLPLTNVILHCVKSCEGFIITFIWVPAHVVCLFLHTGGSAFKMGHPRFNGDNRMVAIEL